MPDRVDIVAGAVAQMLVLDRGVERLAVERPLPRTIVAGHDRPVAEGLGVSGRRQCRPILGAIAGAGGFPVRLIFVERIEPSSLGVGIDRAGRGNIDPAIASRIVPPVFAVWKVTPDGALSGAGSNAASPWGRR